MKSFKALILIALVVVIGGVGALYGANYLENGAVEQMQDVVVTTDQEIGEEEIIEPEVERDPLESGSYFLFHNQRVVDDLETEGVEVDYDFYRLTTRGELERIATINHNAWIGGLYTTVNGEELHVRRYQESEQDAIMNLYGEIVEVRPEGTTRMSSPNGRYELEMKTTFVEGGDHQQEFVVIDTQQQGVIATFSRDDFGEDLTWEIVPYHIDSQGEYMYARLVCGCEGVFPDQWQVNINTGEITKFSDLLETHSNFLTSLNPSTRQVLAVAPVAEWVTDGPYQNLIPPTVIQLLDLDTMEVQNLLTDEQTAWTNPIIDPWGIGRYMVQAEDPTAWEDDSYKNYLVSTQDGEIDEEIFFAEGRVLDWQQNVVLLQRDDLFVLKDIETKEEIELMIPDAEQIRYIGSITIE